MYQKFIKNFYIRRKNLSNFASSNSLVLCSVNFGSKKFNQKIFDYLKKPVITDKATKLIEQKQYTFDVDSQLTKTQIKKIFENYYDMQIQTIRTHRITRKKMRSHKFKPVKRVILVFKKKKEIPIFQNLVQEQEDKKRKVFL